MRKPRPPALAAAATIVLLSALFGLALSLASGAGAGAAQFFVRQTALHARLHVGAAPKDGTHVTPADQRLAVALGISSVAAVACRARSSAGTVGWTHEQFKAATSQASLYRARRKEIVMELSSTDISRPQLWFDRMPHMEECAALFRYGGNGDGGKWLCALDAVAAPCVIYSLGSYGDFKFEEAMVGATQCDIFSFDCFVPPEKVPSDLHPRIHFEPVCVGSDSADGRFQSLATITRRLNHSSLQVLKFDVEGAEFGVIETMAATALADLQGSYHFMPDQLSFEAHLHALNTDAQVRADAMVTMFQRLLDVGYVPVSREVNHLCPHCEEFVFIRLAADCWGTRP